MQVNSTAATLAAMDGKGKNGMDICGKVVLEPMVCYAGTKPHGTERGYGVEGSPMITAQAGGEGATPRSCSDA